MRSNYVIARIIILLLLLAACLIGRDALIRKALIHAGQSMTGAQVEIGLARSSFADGKIQLRDFAVADPSDPRRNLIQADYATLSLNLDRLWHREFVVENASMSQVMFGAPRAEPGALSRSPDSHAFDAAPAAPEINTSDSRPRRLDLDKKWRDMCQTRSSIPRDADDTQIAALAERLRNDWPPLINDHGRRVHEVRPRLKRVKLTIASIGENLLRDEPRRLEAVSQLKSLRQELDQLHLELNKFQADATEDRQALIAAERLDQAALDKLENPLRFDNDGAGQLLFSELETEYVAEIVDWFRWFRDSMPAGGQEFRSSRGRGADIPFPEIVRHPNLWIKVLELDGEGKMAGQHFNFSGVAHNLSTDPTLVDKPITFELRAQGNSHVVVNCELDRRTSHCKDSMTIRCPDLRLPAQTLGSESSLLINVSPCRVQADIKLVADGNALSGELVFRHSDFVMQIDRLEQLEGGKEIARIANLDLGTISHYDSRAQLSGTVANVHIDYDTDLGNHFAQVMNQVIEKLHQDAVQTRRGQLKQVLARETQILDQNVFAAIKEFKSLLNTETELIAKLKDKVPSESSWPKIR
jgi:uncharacterized protein (TIGR03545 family)